MTADYPVELLGTVEPDPAGVILGTGYMRFKSPIGVDGLAKWTEERLDILAVHTDERGKGHFREFIRQAKERYKTICVWEDFNPVVGKALARYGFKPDIEIQIDGEILVGWRWEKTL
jgi:GNAT superfamily N-acetyltransferase